MRVAVVGSRDYPRLEDVDDAVDGLSPDDTVVSGGARGVDLRAKARALSRGLAYDEFLADWTNEGRGAGLVRNERMLATAEHVIALWDGVSKGTQHAISYALKRNIPVRIIRWAPKLQDWASLLDELRRMHASAAAHGYVMPDSIARTLNWLKITGIPRLINPPDAPK